MNVPPCYAGKRPLIKPETRLGTSKCTLPPRNAASHFSTLQRSRVPENAENRLPRGRTYVRNGSVLDLQIAPGKVTALVMGSSLYKISVSIQPLSADRWKSLKSRCAGKIDSLVGLLEGRLSDAVMRVMTEPKTGLFPLAAEIKKSCSCPDWADLCKHLAAVLYGVGVRLDSRPELLFVLRGVDHLDLLDAGVSEHALGSGESTLDVPDFAGVFGIDIAEDPGRGASPQKQPKPLGKSKKTARTATPKRAAAKPVKKPARRKASGKEAGKIAEYAARLERAELNSKKRLLRKRSSGAEMPRRD